MSLILVIDDEIKMLLMMQKVLASARHSVIVAGNGREGLALFDKERPPLVITDIFMPDMEGIEFIIDLRRSAPAVKILATSGGGAARQLSWLDIAQKFGADAVLQKPFRAAELLHSVERLLSTTRWLDA